MNAPYRDDPEWQAAQEKILTDAPGEDDTQALLRRIGAALWLYAVEHRYGDGA